MEMLTDGAGICEYKVFVGIRTLHFAFVLFRASREDGWWMFQTSTKH